jgi:WD40 repeat protein
MPIPIACACGKKLQAPDAYAGKLVRCPACQLPISVPIPQPAEADDEVVEAIEVLDDGDEDEGGVYSLNADDARLASRLGGDPAGGAKVAGAIGSVTLEADAEVACLAFGSSNSQGLAGQEDLVLLLDLKREKELGAFKGHRDAVSCLAVSPDRSSALSGDDHGDIWLWQIERAQKVCLLQGHRDRVTGLAFSPDGRHALSGSADGSARLWNLQTGKEARLHEARWSMKVVGVACSSDGRTVVAAGSEGRVRIWSIETGEPLRTFKASDRLGSVTFSMEGDLVIAAGSRVLDAWKWNIHTSKKIPCFSNPSRNNSTITYAWVVPGGRYVLTTGAFNLEYDSFGDRVYLDEPNLMSTTSSEYIRQTGMVGAYNVQLWNVETGHRVHSYDTAEPMCRCFAVSADGSRALSASVNGRVFLWGLG